MNFAVTSKIEFRSLRCMWRSATWEEEDISIEKIARTRSAPSEYRLHSSITSGKRSVEGRSRPPGWRRCLAIDERRGFEG